LEARGEMQLGSYLAGMAIENSMLGATHACANPLTTHYSTVHGAALAMLLPSVVRWNGAVAAYRYADLVRLFSTHTSAPATAPTETLAQRLEELASSGALHGSLSAAGVPAEDLRMLAEEAAEQWTGTFNPRPFDQAGALEVYECAY
ncbi:MAG: iron-containing alcohol dehydrogenase, partial [Pyrinomonadaceae bacterium]